MIEVRMILFRRVDFVVKMAKDSKDLALVMCGKIVMDVSPS
jgi:hypothetical protein